MLSSSTSRVRRVLVISAAAVAVMIAPTACQYGGTGASPGGSSDMSDMPGMDHGPGGMNSAKPQPVVVPVADTRPASADWRYHHGHGNDPVTTTTAAAPADPTTSTTAPATAVDTTTAAPVATDTTTATAPVVGEVDTVRAGGADGKNNGLDVLGRDCSASKLTPHDGFQKSPACVSTQMGEVAGKDKLPSLLITGAPRVVGMNQAFTLKVSTRNLVRDRFLGAKVGGYYLESSFLNADGLQRGHFHTACRILPNTNEAPDSSVDPQFFLATEDKKGGAAPDTVTIPVPAIGKPGILQCTSWAGDGSHRTPMMTQANETPAIDSVRIFVTRRNQPVRFDRAAAAADAQANIAAQAQPGTDPKPQPPAAPSAQGAPATEVNESGQPLGAPDPAAPADQGDGSTAAPAAAPASDAPAAGN